MYESVLRSLTSTRQSFYEDAVGYINYEMKACLDDSSWEILEDLSYVRFEKDNELNNNKCDSCLKVSTFNPDIQSAKYCLISYAESIQKILKIFVMLICLKNLSTLQELF
ncbi:hypothetical protein CEXT_515541 [Caerostris extrusa]|uniref:Uncharacterized protein n=1 Tax=Caerostris extrusa TaxID=172846 RepID=A0AAV4VJH7_CAEEX|nr:hypothetical protein CEXT_515541 [Caerostris extrusa]